MFFSESSQATNIATILKKFRPLLGSRAYILLTQCSLFKVLVLHKWKNQSSNELRRKNCYRYKKFEQ